jgi:hypothetical protein
MGVHYSSQKMEVEATMTSNITILPGIKDRDITIMTADTIISMLRIKEIRVVAMKIETISINLILGRQEISNPHPIIITNNSNNKTAK